MIRQQLIIPLCLMLAIPLTSWGQNPHRNPQTAKQWSGATNTKVHVNCDKGDRLGRALKRAPAGTTFLIKGVCNEQVLVTKNYIRLKGIKGAIIDGAIGRSRYEGTVTVRGAVGVTIANLTVRNGPDQGIAVQKHASVALKNVISHNHGTVGVSVDASYLEASNVESYNNGTGFDFFTGATVIALGPLVATNNSGAGVEVNANSTLELRGAVIDTSNNGGDGITLVNDSHMVILSFPESQGSGVNAQANRGAAGMFVANSSLAVVGSQFAGDGSNQFNISGHGVGMLFISSNLASPFGTATFNIAMNGVGILFTDDSDAIVVGGLQVSGNEVGILGDGAGVLRIPQNPLNPSNITGNTAVDVGMTFGSRLDIGAGIATRINCDPTVITPTGPLLLMRQP